MINKWIKLTHNIIDMLAGDMIDRPYTIFIDAVRESPVLWGAAECEEITPNAAMITINANAFDESALWDNVVTVCHELVHAHQYSIGMLDDSSELPFTEIDYWFSMDEVQARQWQESLAALYFNRKGWLLE